jgi:hypothetical protein
MSTSQAQTIYPAQINVFLIPPYSLYLDDYTTGMLSNIYAQTGSKQQFEQFLQKFDLNNYPIVVSDNYEKRTKIIKTQNGMMDEKLLNLFVYGQGIKKVGLACDIGSFQSYFSYFQLPATDSVYVVALTPDMKDAVCGEGLLLVTYSKLNNQFQDTLWFALRSALNPQYIDNQKVVCNLDIEESIIANDSIYLERKEAYYLRFNNVPKGGQYSKKIKSSHIYTTYQMTVGGKFIKIRERREDEILDTIANKLK